MPYKPEGYPDLSPYLVVPDAELTLRFCREVLGGEEKRIHRKDTGEIGHGEVRVGDSLVMFGQIADGPAGMIHLYLPDPDDAFRKAIAFGATELQPVTDQEDGDRRGGVKDQNGASWYFARQA